MTQPAVTVPAGPTSCARRRLAREGSAYPARRGVHTLHTVSLFRPSPKVAMNLLIVEDHKNCPLRIVCIKRAITLQREKRIRSLRRWPCPIDVSPSFCVSGHCRYATAIHGQVLGL